MSALLEVQDLRATFQQGGRPVEVLHGVSFQVAPGEALGVIGESGSGKSVMARAVMRLAPENSSVKLSGQIRYRGTDLLALSERQMTDYRGQKIAMVFQDPMTSLNPTMTVGAQIDDMVMRHKGLTKAQARERTVELLDQVGIRNPRLRADDHPHHFSGGMRQRALIAMAVSCDPDLLIADEPTTALDVTVQAQILRLLMRLREDRKMAMMLITHDFGVIAGMVDRVNVMQHGHIVETGEIGEVFARPQHEYTQSLLAAIPRLRSAEVAS